MKFTPYPYQELCIADACNFLSSAQRGQKKLYAAPTGCGKSVMELSIKDRLGTPWIVTPRDEILQGMLEKLDMEDADPISLQMCTPIKLRNRLLEGAIRPPKHLIFDEGHHHNAESWQQLQLLTGDAPAVAFTASPYRGSPRSTREFLDIWGEPTWVITYDEAVREGYISKPAFHMLPLVDDDVVEVQGGDFSVTSIESATVNRLGDMAEHARAWYDNHRWDKPTIFAMPSSELCRQLKLELESRGMPSVVVSCHESKASRLPAFKACVERIVAILHINVVTEGVDLPLRRLVDMAPTMSPVKWVQQLGRITRPSPEPPEYWCTNRNILRHAYALQGYVPVSAVQEAAKIWPESSRGHSRVVGLEAIGRFKPTTVKALSGVTCHMYSLSTLRDSTVVEFCAIAHPAREVLWAIKVNQINSDGTRSWGNWRKCESPTDMVGFNSVAPKPPSEKQLSWWKRAATRYGIDPEQDVTRKNFQALPVLADLGERL